MKVVVEGYGGSCCSGRKLNIGEEKCARPSADSTSQSQVFEGPGAVVKKGCR